MPHLGHAGLIGVGDVTIDGVISVGVGPSRSGVDMVYIGMNTHMRTYTPTEHLTSKYSARGELALAGLSTLVPRVVKF